MALTYRVKCPTCGKVQNLPRSGPCVDCGETLKVNQQGAIALYRMGNFIGAVSGYGIYLNGQPYGAIGNRETIILPLPYGSYRLHIVCGMNRQCNDPVIRLTPKDPFVCLKVHVRLGFNSNRYIIQRVDPDTMP